MVELNKIYNEDCLLTMSKMPDNSVDTIITDPPYGLKFMGKKWDYEIPTVEHFTEMLRVAKPGATLLCFGGTRTWHRIAVNIEDAGWEIFDNLYWCYGCLSEDTEILTQNGYRHLHKTTKNDRILAYDIQADIYQWERPQGWQVYRVNKDTAFRIQSDYTDQIVSRNHRCVVERDGKLVFKKAEELSGVEYMPILPEDFYSIQKRHRELLLSKLLRKSKGLVKKLFSKWQREEMSEQGNENGKEPRLERWSNLLEEAWELQTNKVCEVSSTVSSDGEERWVCNGTSFDNGSIVGEMFRDGRSNTSYQSRPTGQQTGEPAIISIKQGTQTTRRARITKIKYSGLMFCPTVSTGVFVARRNGKVFITGNSGFPKSLNIGKAVDKMQGNEREFIGEIKRGDVQKAKESGSGYLADTANRNNVKQFGYGVEQVTKGTSEWEGWGTALKPAVEPVLFCSKPLTVSQLFGIIIEDISNTIQEVLRCYNLPVNDVAKVLSGIRAKLEKEQGVSVHVDAKTNVWVNTASVKYVAQSFIFSNQESSEQTRIKENFVQSNVKRSGNGNILQENQTHIGEVDAMLTRIQDISMSVITEGISESTALLWNNISVDLLKQLSIFTIETGLRLTTALRTLKSYLMQTISEDTGNLSPNVEPIIVARKPNEGTYAENALKYGVAGLNIDESRIPTDENRNREQKDGPLPAKYGFNNNSMGNRFVELNPTGRFPSNLILSCTCESEHEPDCPVRIMDEQSGTSNSRNYQREFNDSGGASRFFYCAKASKSERNLGLEDMPDKPIPYSEYRENVDTTKSFVSKYPDGTARPMNGSKNHHPTVKPLKLMEYLCTLTKTPTGGIVLDPFMGSGSTGIACVLTGRGFIGCELTTEYFEIAKARIEEYSKQGILL